MLFCEQSWERNSGWTWHEAAGVEGLELFLNKCLRIVGWWGPEKGSSSSLADCPYRVRQFRNTQMIIPGLSCAVMLFSHQQGQTQSSKSGVHKLYGTGTGSTGTTIIMGTWMHQCVLPRWCMVLKCAESKQVPSATEKCFSSSEVAPWEELDQVIILRRVSPEQVNEEDGDGEQEKDRVEEESDDHSRRTWLVSSMEVPVKLCCVTHRCVWAVGETLRGQRSIKWGSHDGPRTTAIFSLFYLTLLSFLNHKYNKGLDSFLRN